MRGGLITLIGMTLPLWVHAENPAILVNPQGLAQHDLSIRGSSYLGNGLSINGINLKVPYSAHFNSALPLYGPWLSGAVARSGLDNVSGHLAGTAARTIQLLEPQSSTTLGLGTEEHYRASTLGSTENIAGFIDWEKARRIDYDANDLERFNGGAVVQFFQNDWRFDILSSGESKEYGAQGYYGIPSSVYAEEETDDNLLLASAFKGDLYGSFMRAGVSLREFDQEYRIPSSSFLSEVRSRHGALALEGRTLEVQHIALNLRGDLEHERVSGDIGTHLRTRGSILILPEARFERFTFKAGLNSVFQTDESAEWLPQAGIDYALADNTKLFAGYTETVQQPDYQLLYYFDPYHSGNEGLDLQRARQVEMGLHQYFSARLDARAAVFHRRQENAWDWTKAVETDVAWMAADLGALNVYGVDAKVDYLASDELKLQFYYQWIKKDDYDLYAGLYALDYPEHLLGLSGFWQVTPEIQLFGTQTLRCQTGHKVRNGKEFGAEAALGLHYDPRFAKNMRLSFRVENLWDSDFQPIPGLKPRPLSVSTGITVAW